MAIRDMDELFVSVIIPVYNSALFLRRAVLSVVEESTRHPLEILIIDDGSSDSSLLVAQELAREFPDVVKPCLQHPNNANRGPGASRNLGIAHARGNIIGFLDADDRWYSGRLDVAMDILSRHDAVDGVFDACAVSLQNDTARIEWYRRPKIYPDEYRGITQGRIITFEVLVAGEPLWLLSSFLVRRSLH